MLVPLAEAESEADFGGKAVHLGKAIRAGLPVPEGLALATDAVAAVGAGEPWALDELSLVWPALEHPLAVRSSAVGEDSDESSFAGQHRTCLNVRSESALVEAVRAVWESAHSASALAYRRRLGVTAEPRVAAVVQRLVEPDAAGVLFTRNPLDGSDERLIEASWGLGEVVVAGLVIPDLYRVSRSGEVLERRCGTKSVALVVSAAGGTQARPVPANRVERLCLADEHVGALHALAEMCEEVFGSKLDIEWAVADGAVYLLQCRSITRIAA